ncbi:hypothetical protein N431DRAFT_329001 [Stipitochalara longipes BDJ]|nr:hypothetical protein N431DRAFT_329001 [Stipitochalara longipes BDJ]
MAKDAAAKDLKAKKRKASTSEHDAEKPKKVKNPVADDSAAPAKKPTDDAASVKAKKSKTPADSTPAEALVPTDVKKVKKPKPNVNGGSDAKPAKKVEASDKPVEKKDKKVVKALAKPVKDNSNGKSALASSKTDKSVSKKQKPTEKIEAATEDREGEELDEDTEDELDDQTEALLKGFESDSDEQDATVKEIYKKGDAIPSITENKELSKKKQAKLKKVAEFPGQGQPGVVYVGRIPHGFFENEMRAYFGQFGNILRLRLSRNKRTGASRHFAFIEFENSGVADIVAKTMDNYLMFGHILKVKFVPDEQVPAYLWKGANKRFKKVPWNKMKGRELEQGASEEVWEQRIQLEQERRDNKAKKLKAIGYEFDAPKIKPAKGVSKKAKPVPELTDEGETEAVKVAPVSEEKTKAIDEAPLNEESSKPKKKKKPKAAKEDAGVAAIKEPGKAEKEEITVTAKPSKEEVEESVAALIAEATEKPVKKAKKDKKKSTEVAVPEEKTAKIDPIAESSKPKKNKKNKKASVVAE